MKTPVFALLFLVSSLFLAAGCESTANGAKVGSPRRVVLDQAGRPQGLPQYLRMTERVGQGGQPEGDVAFANLAALGFTTALSVDGARPAVKTAARHGIRYVHIPIGYDGVPPEQARRIIKAVELSKGPVYIHCHYGKHRGPAAAAVVLIAVEGVSNEDAVAHLRKSQTSRKYTGLYYDVARFRGPNAAELAQVPDEFPSVVEPAGMVASMVHVSHRWEFLKASREAGWKTPDEHPDVSPPHEARMLWEQMREIARLDESARKGAKFLKELKASERAAVQLEEALRGDDPSAANAAYEQVHQSCNRCHADFRN